MTVEVSSTRVTGKRVIHTHTKSWDVPYCTACLAHIRASRALRSFSMRVTHLSFVFGLFGAILTFFALLLTFPYSAVGAILLSLAAAGATAGFVCFTYPWCKQKYLTLLGEKKRRRKILEENLRLSLSSTCCVEGALAVQYEGWHGSVHTFFFSSSHFARAFTQANPGKCLSRGQIHH